VAADQLAEPTRREADDIGHQLDGEAEGQKPDDVKMAALDGGDGGLVQALEFCPITNLLQIRIKSNQAKFKQ
jgi:hypothetical protein